MSDQLNAKIAEVERLEKRIEKLEKIAPASADKAKEKLEAAKEELARSIETEAAKPAPQPVANVVAAAAAASEGDLKEKIMEVASTLASAEQEGT